MQNINKEMLVNITTGTIIVMNKNIAPTKFLACDGKRYLSKTYPELASFLNENPKKRFFNTPIPWIVFTEKEGIKEYAFIKT